MEGTIHEPLSLDRLWDAVHWVSVGIAGTEFVLLHGEGLSMSRTPTYYVSAWFERDRLSLVLYDQGNQVVAEWWDEDAQSMFEDGFFQGGRKLPESVLDYARDMGLVPKDAQLMKGELA